LFGRPHDRSITVRGEQGTLVWSYDPNQLRMAATAEAQWQATNFTCERNQMFFDAAHEFLRVIGGEQRPSCTVEDGYAVMRVVEAIRTSSATGQVVTP
ncbi:MAG: Gfo/Idh/MocA family oxidoreductase, partial [Chloroflexota bacterium]|nr:Gfo/Idh/MocA family oxidoreductase [Chloroflexota bacterium]